MEALVVKEAELFRYFNFGHNKIIEKASYEVWIVRCLLILVPSY